MKIKKYHTFLPIAQLLIMYFILRRCHAEVTVNCRLHQMITCKMTSSFVIGNACLVNICETKLWGPFVSTRFDLIEHPKLILKPIRRL